MVICPTCGAENNDERAYCAACGVALPVEPAWRCRTCGAVNSMLNATCQDCGDMYEPLSQQMESAASAVAEGNGSSGNGYMPEPALAPPDGQDAALPEWLAKIEREASETTGGPEDSTPLAESEAAASLQEGTAAELPPWLEGMAVVPVQAAVEEQVSEPPERPEWLPVEEPPGEADLSLALEDTEVAPPGEMPAWLGELITQIGVPDMLATPAETAPEGASEAGASGERAVEGAPEGDAAPELPAAEAPAWLSPEALSPWAEEAHSALPAESDGAEPAAAEPEVAQAELPVWLQAMQAIGPIVAPPGDSVVSSEADARPLAGMRVILPAEPIVAVPRLGATVPGLVVTEEQAAQAELLRSLLTAGPEPLPEPLPAPRNWRAWVERWSVALALLAAIVVALVLQPGLLPAPEATAPTQSAYQIIQGLRPESPVLVAFDYETASSGEMGPLALALLRHLADRNAHVIALSTRPMGPALAQMALDALAAEGANVRYGEQAVNLGYLPGGPVGLSAFALNPAILNRDYVDGGNPWAKPGAKGLVSLAQAQALVVLSSDALSLRDWVEQVGTAFPNLPIIAATSASVEPLARPYYESGQLKGLVAGLPGADSYETLTGKPALATHLREAQGFAQGVALLVLVIGALAALVRRIMDARRRTTGEGPQGQHQTSNLKGEVL